MRTINVLFVLLFISITVPIWGWSYLLYEDCESPENWYCNNISISNHAFRGNQAVQLDGADSYVRTPLLTTPGIFKAYYANTTGSVNNSPTGTVYYSHDYYGNDKLPLLVINVVDNYNYTYVDLNLTGLNDIYLWLWCNSQPDPTQHIVIDEILVTNRPSISGTTSYDFGTVDQNATSSEVTFSITGSNLGIPRVVSWDPVNPATVSVTAPSGYEIKKAGESTWQPALSLSINTNTYLDWSGGTISDPGFVVRFKPTSFTADYNQSITVSCTWPAYGGQLPDGSETITITYSIPVYGLIQKLPGFTVQDPILNYPTTVTIPVNLTYTGYAPDVIGVYYGTTTVFDHESSIISASETGTYYVPLTGLVGNTTYFYRVFAKNCEGSYVYSSYLTFHTLPSEINQPDPSSLDLGNVAVGLNSVNTFLISGARLTGNLELNTPSSGYLISLDNANYAASKSITPVNGTVQPTTVYVKFSPMEAQVYPGVVNIATPGGDSRSVALSGQGVGYIGVSPGNLSLGQVLVDYQRDSSYHLSGHHLTYPVIISSPNGFTISSDNLYFYNSLYISPDGGLIDKTIYVRFHPTSIDVYNGIISHSSNMANTAELTVSGTGYSKLVIGNNVAKDITHNSARLGGNITTINNSLATEIGVHYSEHPDMADSLLASETGSYDTGEFTVPVPDSSYPPLETYHTYYFRSYAINEAGITYANSIDSFTTLSLIVLSDSVLSFPRVKVGLVSDTISYLVSGISMIDDITVSCPDCFEISLSQTGVYSHQLIIPRGRADDIPPTRVYVKFSPSYPDQFSSYISHSANHAATEYLHVTGTGFDKPTVSPYSTNAELHSVDIGGDVNTNYATVTRVGVYHSINKNMADSTGYEQSGSFENGVFTFTASPLEPVTEYYYRAFAENEVGRAYSVIGKFMTLPFYNPPTLFPATAISHCGFTVRWQENDPVANITLRCYDANSDSLLQENEVDSYMPPYNAIRIEHGGILPASPYYYKIRNNGSYYSDSLNVSTTSVIPGVGASTIIAGNQTRICIPAIVDTTAFPFVRNDLILDPTNTLTQDIYVHAVFCPRGFEGLPNVRCVYFIQGEDITITPGNIRVIHELPDIYKCCVRYGYIRRNSNPIWTRLTPSSIFNTYSTTFDLAENPMIDEPDDMIILALEPNEMTCPVTLSYFNAELCEAGSIKIKWITQSETNISGYYVLRGTNGNLPEAIQLNVLMPGTNTSVEHTYELFDTEIPEADSCFYWLMSCGLDGAIEFFGPAAIGLSQPGEEPPMPQIPVVTALLDAFPNPFNPVTNIHYLVKESGLVTIDIYNVRGQLVRSFNQNHANPGHYRFIWDGKDTNGCEVSSGVYFYRMHSEKYTNCKKMVLIK